MRPTIDPESDQRDDRAQVAGEPQPSAAASERNDVTTEDVSPEKPEIVLEDIQQTLGDENQQLRREPDPVARPSNNEVLERARDGLNQVVQVANEWINETTGLRDQQRKLLNQLRSRLNPEISVGELKSLVEQISGAEQLIEALDELLRSFPDQNLTSHSSPPMRQVAEVSEIHWLEPSDDGQGPVPLEPDQPTARREKEEPENPLLPYRSNLEQRYLYHGYKDPSAIRSAEKNWRKDTPCYRALATTNLYAVLNSLYEQCPTGTTMENVQAALQQILLDVLILIDRSLRDKVIGNVTRAFLGGLLSGGLLSGGLLTEQGLDWNNLPNYVDNLPEIRT